MDSNTCNLELDEKSLKKGQLRINFNLLKTNSGKIKTVFQNQNYTSMK